ncbi:hypothetical protein HJC23_011624 [Cyclotella cryptica]|uniref:Amino acid transporter n=1 Tax=Cyclotella cryptica TaxID=29204 RepID=A0ABD3QTW2_9STRA|eukprot:CCRYP_002774-RA/>CCRYP_002774-RA protein AED:0.10 eAED:0.10 QI:91/0.83/0.85/1/0.66/0.57/7/165/559
MDNEDVSSMSRDLSTPLLTSRHDDPTQSLQGLTVTDEIDGDGSSTPACSELCAVHPREHRPIDDKVTALTLAMIIFYNVTGGPFGIEPSVKAAGNFYAIIGISLMPFVWAVPEMYMTYRLSEMFPCASGGVLWVEKAMNPTMGLVQGYLGWLGGVVNAASYPALLYEYIMSQFFSDAGQSEVNSLLRYGFIFLLALLLAIVNYRGLVLVGKASTLIYIVSMSAFLVMAIIGFPKVDPQKWLQTPQMGLVEQFDDDSLSTSGWLPVESLAGIACKCCQTLRKFVVLSCLDFVINHLCSSVLTNTPFLLRQVNNLFWNFNNFDQAGHYSVSVPKKTFQRGLSVSLLLVSSAYLIPVLVATGATDIEQSDWKAGTFAVAGTDIAGKWLGNWIVVSTAISVGASFCSELAADSMQLMGMADRAQIPSIFSHRSSFGTPTYSIIMCLIVIASVLPLEFGLIIELSNFAYCVSVTMEFMAFVQLQIRKGDDSILRKVFYALLVVPALIINLLVILLASYATYIYAAVVVVIGLLFINAKVLGSCVRKCFRSRRGHSVESLDKIVV